MLTTRPQRELRSDGCTSSVDTPRDGCERLDRPHQKGPFIEGRRLARSLLLSSVLLSSALPAWAQGTGPLPVNQATDGDEILVVATRREQSQQDVPLAITAIGQDALQLNQVDAISDIGSLTPNLITVPGTAGGARSAPQFSIRGQTQQERGGLADPSVGVYFGDVVMSRTQGINQTLFDIRAVEVIRGPVGTLFGRNATGGAVIIRPNLPNTNRFEGSVGATLAEFGTINADAYANIPVSGNFAIRLGAATSNSDGYVFDQALGRRVNRTETLSARAATLLRFGRFENVTMVNFFDEDDGGSAGFAAFLNPAGSIATLAAARGYRPVATLLAEQRARGPLRINNGLAEFNDVETFDFHNTSTYRVNDQITIRNIFGWREVDSHILVDLDGTEHPLLHTEIFDDAEQVSNEFQILGDMNRFDWIIGGYYFHESGDNNASSTILGTETGAIDPPNQFVTGGQNNRQLFDNTSLAVFAEGTYQLTDTLSVTLGGRYTWENREAVILNRFINTRCAFTIDDDGNPATPEVNPGDTPACRVATEANFDAFTYNAAVNWQPDRDTLIYASLRRGFRAGGFSARATREVGLRRPFDPEFVRNIEIGIKRDWHFGGAFLRTNLALFRSNYSNVQRNAVDTTSGSPFTVIINAAQARIQGIEAEVIFRPFRALELSAFWGHIDAQFTEFIDPFTGADRSNQPFGRVPKNNWRLAGTLNLFDRPNVGTLSFTAAYSGRDSYLESDTAVAPFGVIPAHEQLDLYLRFANVAATGLDVTLFARNVTDDVEILPLAGVYESLGFAARGAGPPRQFGVQLRYNFGRNR
ncbi:MAG: TonB-dependent receptor [Flavobacteriaceae bacterium]